MLIDIYVDRGIWFLPSLIIKYRRDCIMREKENQPYAFSTEELT